MTTTTKTKKPAKTSPKRPQGALKALCGIPLECKADHTTCDGYACGCACHDAGRVRS